MGNLIGIKRAKKNPRAKKTTKVNPALAPDPDAVVRIKTRLAFEINN